MLVDVPEAFAVQLILAYDTELTVLKFRVMDEIVLFSTEPPKLILTASPSNPFAVALNGVVDSRVV